MKHLLQHKDETSSKLYLDNKRINKIEGLEKFKYLRFLLLRKNGIQKMENLNSSLNLTELCLSENKLSKIECLDENTKLSVLYLSKNWITKMEGFEKLRRLIFLFLDNNPIIHFGFTLNNVYTLDVFVNHTYIFKLDLTKAKNTRIHLKETLI
jgi:Leucine-rich repeat (LRR) protein